MDDVYYQNQKQYCQQNNVPMFASRNCSHTYPWVRDDLYGKLQTLGEMLVDKYGEEKAFTISSGSLITSCPGCGRSWCD
jgi:hypothetical protein